MGQARKNYIRFTPTRLNRVILHTLQHLPSIIPGSSVEEKTISIASDHGFQREILCCFVATGKVNYVIFPVAKDHPSHTVEGTLQYVGEFVAAAINDSAFPKDATLLIPLRQCRNYFPDVQREHIILLEVNLKNKTLRAYDSQSAARCVAYNMLEDALSSLGQECKLSYAFSSDYYTFDMQDEDMLCGYYVHQYVIQRLIGNSCQDVKLRLIEELNTNDIFIQLVNIPGLIRGVPTRLRPAEYDKMFIENQCISCDMAKGLQDDWLLMGPRQQTQTSSNLFSKNDDGPVIHVIHPKPKNE